MRGRLKQHLDRNRQLVEVAETELLEAAELEHPDIAGFGIERRSGTEGVVCSHVFQVREANSPHQKRRMMHLMRGGWEFKDGSCRVGTAHHFRHP